VRFTIQGFTFSENTTAVIFTGWSGGLSRVVTVTYTTTTNDPKGYIVQMSATSDKMTDGSGTPPVLCWPLWRCWPCSAWSW